MDKDEFLRRMQEEELEKHLYKRAFSLTTNKEKSEDLVQSSIEKMLLNVNKFVVDFNFVGWSTTLLKNIFLNDYKKTVREQTHVDYNVTIYDIDSVHDSGIGNPEEEYNVQEIYKIIDTLEPKLKKVFELYLDDYKYQDIADELGIPLNTVKSRMFKAREILQNKLKEYRL